MKALIVSVPGLETRALAANSPAPQLGECSLDGNVSFALVDGAGQVVLQRQQPIKTFHNFLFDTATETLPKPFIGQMVYSLDRKNRGGGRLATQWYSKTGVAVTHENGSTGRPKVFLPVPLDRSFLDGPNRMFIALVNPHNVNNPFELKAFGRDKQIAAQGTGTLGPFNSLWVDIEDSFLKPLREKTLPAELYLGLQTLSFSHHTAVSCYFFIHNLTTGAWSCQHV